MSSIGTSWKLRVQCLLRLREKKNNPESSVSKRITSAELHMLDLVAARWRRFHHPILSASKDALTYGWYPIEVHVPCVEDSLASSTNHSTQEHHKVRALLLGSRTLEDDARRFGTLRRGSQLRYSLAWDIYIYS